MSTPRKPRANWVRERVKAWRLGRPACSSGEWGLVCGAEEWASGRGWGRCLRTEVGGEAHEGASAEGLDDPCHTGDFCAATINAFEAVEIASPILKLFLSTRGLYHCFECAAEVSFEVVVGLMLLFCSESS